MTIIVWFQGDVTTGTERVNPSIGNPVFPAAVGAVATFGVYWFAAFRTCYRSCHLRAFELRNREVA